MKAKKILAMLLAALLVLTVMVGCTPAESDATTTTEDETQTETAEAATETEAAVSESVIPAVGEDPVTIEVMTWQYNDAEIEALNQTIALYNAKYPNVTVDLVPVEDYLTEYKLAFDGGEAPDVVYVDDTTQVLLERYNYLMDITEYVDAYGWKDLALGGILEYQNARHEGQYYSAAQNSNPRVCWYNTNIFDELGLAVPTTLDELDAVCETIKNAGYIPFESDPTTLLWIMGELVFDYTPYEDVKQWYYLEDTTDAMQEGWLKAAEKIEEWIDKGYFRPEILSLDTTNAFMMFAGGTSAMFYCSGDISGYFGAYVDGFTVGAFQFPTAEAGDEKVIVSGAHSGWAVNSDIDSSKLGAALEFINMFYTEEVNAIWIRAGYFSSLDYDISDIAVDDAYRAAAGASENTQIGFFLDNAETGLLDKMLTLNQSLLLGDVTPEDYVAQLDAAYESLKAEQTN